MLSRFFGFDKLNFFLYYVCILSGCCVTVARTVWDRLVWVRIPAARHEVALGFEPSKGGRGKVFSPCRKLFKTEGFERRSPRLDGERRVLYPSSPTEIFLSKRGYNIAAVWHPSKVHARVQIPLPAPRASVP